jgi:hypothetical protein
MFDFMAEKRIILEKLIGNREQKHLRENVLLKEVKIIFSN